MNFIQHVCLALALFMVLLTFIVSCSDHQTYKAQVARCLANGGSELKCTGRVTGIDN